MPISRDRPGLHHVGSRVSQALGLRDEELAALSLAPQLPTWESNLRVGELAYDSVALSSLAIALAGADRGGSQVESFTVSPDPARVQASFGSERLFRIDGAAPPIWAPLSGFWQVDDGWVRTHGNYPHHAERLTRLLGISSDAERTEVEAAMLTWSRLEIEKRAAEAGALVLAVRTSAEWRQHPHHTAVEDGPIVRFASGGDAAPRPWLPFSGRPLSGIRVLDLTRVIAGPVATRDLAVAGADVLRIDSPRLPESQSQHLDTGHEKRSALLDLGDPGGHDTFQRLLETADVVVHGYRPGALARYGLDVESLHLRFPGIVVAQLSAWGTDGPWGERRGFDSLVQAATGISLVESRDGGTTPGALPVQALDHSAGHFLAASVATALRAQRSHGGSFEIDVNLARIAHELLAAGPSDRSNKAGDAPELPTESLSLRVGAGESRSVVTCAPPLLDFPGAPTRYVSPLHRWGSDRPEWADEITQRRG
ncbi:CoA transferase [Microbacterium sp.]|uniref:CoA transferase n=1 Tax=Microbacterium sp. TaxID=51671 RepID=UPI0039E47F08